MNKELIYLKGFAKGHSLFELLKAINAATKLHEGQIRNNGEPFIIHPTRVTSHLVSLGIHDDIMLASAILHDVVEDCGVTIQTLMLDYGIDPATIAVVKLLTKYDAISDEHYYQEISKDQRALLIKISDRCNNVSTMVGAFTNLKVVDYIKETESHIVPLCKHGTRFYPEYSDKIFVMKYHIESVMNAVKLLIA